MVPPGLALATMAASELASRQEAPAEAHVTRSKVAATVERPVTRDGLWRLRRYGGWREGAKKIQEGAMGECGVFMRTVERDGVGCVGCGGWEAGYDVKLHREARVSSGAGRAQNSMASASRVRQAGLAK